LKTKKGLPSRTTLLAFNQAGESYNLLSSVCRSHLLLLFVRNLFHAELDTATRIEV
jgi:hypothetical protein